jgi:hypothetical protein
MDIDSIIDAVVNGVVYLSLAVLAVGGIVMYFTKKKENDDE